MEKAAQGFIDALEILREVGKTLTSSLDSEQVLRAIMDMIAKLYQPKNWSLLLVDEESFELYFAIVVGDAGEDLKDLRLKIGEGIAGWVALHGEPIIVTDAYRDPRFASWVDEKSGFKTESVVCVPLISKGRTLGVIEIFNIAPSDHDDQRLELLQSLSDFAAIAIENSRYVSRIRELTIIDDCTGLFNARHMHNLLETEINRSQRYDSYFSVIFLDLDHFKDVNDTHGHLIGSRLLLEIGQKFKLCLRSVDWAVRYGGDEFVIILPRTNKEDARIVARRLRDALNNSTFFEREGLFVKVTASFGIATFPEDGRTKEDILKLADQAMYRVKDTTRDNIIAVGDAAG